MNESVAITNEPTYDVDDPAAEECTLPEIVFPTELEQGTTSSAQPESPAIR